MLHCDDHGALYQVNPDGSFTELSWSLLSFPSNLYILRHMGEWRVSSKEGGKICVMDTRRSAKNFVRFAAE